MARKMSKGRQKIQMKKMSKESNLLVTFSKRRSGLFKKASELCTLCGVEIAIVVFSPGRKVFSFGHPNVEAIIDRFLMTRNNIPTVTSSTTSQLVEAHRNANVRELNVQLMEIINQLEFEKKREVEIEKIRKAANIGKNWWEGPVNELGLGELEQLKLGMEELKKNVTKQMQKFILEASSSPAGLFLGGSFFNGGQVDDVKNIKGLGLSIATNRNTIFP